MNNRIGVIMGRLFKNVDKGLLSGIIEQAEHAGFEVYIFTVNDECTNRKIMHGEENLLTMINFSLLDGVIYVPYSFASGLYKQDTAEFLKKHCTVPIVRIGAETDSFTPIWYDDGGEIGEIVRHMADEHGCRRMMCMTGPKDNAVSESRAEGFRSAMSGLGLQYDENDIIYGDFWTLSGKQLAEELTDGTRELPDAVICCNDAMAISLCDALMEKGISVPNDIRITGYDGYVESRFHAPSVTTYISAQEQLGRNAVCALYTEIAGNTMTPCRYTTGKLIRHESCGCGVRAESRQLLDFDFERFELGIFDTNLTANMFDSETPDDFFKNTYTMIYTFMSEKLIQYEQLSICLCEDWDQAEYTDGVRNYRTAGYSENMMCIHQHNGKKQFRLSDMKPVFQDREKYPVTVFNALHFLDRCFGYICFETSGAIDDYNRDYVRFIREINNGLNFFCAQNELRRALYRERISNIRDELTGLYLLQNSSQMLDDIIERSELYRAGIYVLIISISDIREIVHINSSDTLDRFLLDFSTHLQKCCNKEDSLFQINDNYFAVIGISNDAKIHCDELVSSLENYLITPDVLQSIGHLVNLRTRLATAEIAEFSSSDDFAEMINSEAVHLDRQWKSLVSASMHAEELMKLRSDIYIDPKRDWTTELCAEMLNISRSYLHRIYKKLFGTSIADDVKTSRLNYAKYLLLTTDDILQVIAEECGLDYFNFMRLFKKETGITPTEYRHSHSS